MSYLALRTWDPCEIVSPNFHTLKGWDCTYQPQETWDLGLGTPCELALRWCPIFYVTLHLCVALVNILTSIHDPSSSFNIICYYFWSWMQSLPQGMWPYYVHFRLPTQVWLLDWIRNPPHAVSNCASRSLSSQFSNRSWGAKVRRGPSEDSLSL